jgi:hypothetical protein
MRRSLQVRKSSNHLKPSSYISPGVAIRRYPSCSQCVCVLCVCGSQSRSRWPRFGLRPLACGIAGSNPGRHGCCECCVLSGRGHCDGLITREGTTILRTARPYCRLETSCCAVPDISKHGYCGNRPFLQFPVDKVKVRLSSRVKFTPYAVCIPLKQAYMRICLQAASV